MSRILIVGAQGMLGRELSRRFPGATGVGRETIDLSEPSIELPPGDWEWVVNAAAYTAVERAESEPDFAFAVNGRGPGLLARACAGRGARLIHVSTDFVFDGESDRPYREEDPPRPLNVYGASKREGEERVLEASGAPVVVRTAWLFGDGPCFPRTMVRLHEESRALRIVDDQRGSPTWTADVAQGIGLLIERSARGGIYHVAGSEAMSWRALAVATLRAWTGRQVPVEGIPAASYHSQVERPASTILDVSRMVELGYRPTPTDEALALWASRLRETAA